LAVVPDPRLARLLAAVRAVRDGDPEAWAAACGDEELAEFDALIDQFTAADETPDSRDRELALKAAQIEQARLGLRERAQQLTLASRAKAEFMANISHELRTPLSSLLILANLLAANSEGNLTPRQVDFARTIHGAAQDLLQLINDLLDLSKAESGRMELRAEPVRLSRLLDQVENAFRQPAADKGLALTVRVTGDVPQIVEADGQRLRQVLRNLLSNAVKFTEKGAVTLEVDRDPQDPALLRLAVHDTGMGIAPDKLNVIFEAFQQADGLTGQRFGGTGLGLSISREMARLLGGDLRVRSAQGHGSTFTLTVPLGAAGEAADQGRPTVRPQDSPERRAALLIVEPPGARAMRQAAHTALDGLSGMRDRVEIVAPHGAEIEQALARREVVGVLVNLGTPREEIQRLLGAVADYAPLVPVLAYEAGAGSAAAARLEASLGSAPQIEIVGSRAQAVERLTLHLLTGLPTPSSALSPLAAEPPQAGRFHGEKVLVVDDDVRNVFAMTSVLELHGLSVLHADNGRQGIDTLVRNPDVKLVLMDLMMPGMDGYAATEHIRGLDRFAELPIIAVTAKAMRGDREKSLAAGANEHVVKPVDVDALLAIIDSMINSR
jgi:signal transduction histidine kinase/CheY-like chemotaxis protein